MPAPSLSIFKGSPNGFRRPTWAPLLKSEQDAHDGDSALANYLADRRKPGEGLILMGHGQSRGQGDLALEGTRAIFKKSNPLIFMATVEGSRTFEDMQNKLKKSDVRTLWLSPLMIGAGEQGRKDLAGAESDSWASLLKKEGYEIRNNLTGLGEIPEMAEISIRHTRNSRDNLMLEPKKPEAETR